MKLLILESLVLICALTTTAHASISDDIQFDREMLCAQAASLSPTTNDQIQAVAAAARFCVNHDAAQLRGSQKVTGKAQDPVVELGSMLTALDTVLISPEVNSQLTKRNDFIKVRNSADSLQLDLVKLFEEQWYN